MEKQIVLGTAGGVDIKIVGGKLSLEAKAATPGSEASVDLIITVGVDVLVDKLKAAVEEKWPASAPIDEIVFGLVKSTLLQL
jgi:hypothetical protein